MSAKPVLLFLCTTSLRDGLPPTQATFFYGVASPRVQVSLATGLQSGGGPTADCIEILGAPGGSPPASPQRPQPGLPSLPWGLAEKCYSIHRRPPLPHRMPQHTQAYPHLPSAWTVRAWRGPGAPQGGLGSLWPGAGPQCPQGRADMFLHEGPHAAEHSHPGLYRAGCKDLVFCSRDVELTD